MRRLALILSLALAAALAAAASAAAYGWPVKPFDKQHPVRGFFGDPRTVFQFPLYLDGLNGPGRFSFHNGVDISAPNGTNVYPVASGIAHVLDGTAISIETFDGRKFQYFHVVPTVVEGERVTARQTVLGYVQPPYAHVHLSEIDGTRITNPLLRGHLSPYRDRTRPTIGDVELRNTQGRLVDLLTVCGHVSIAAAAADLPPIPVVGPFNGLPVVPALVQWQLDRLGHGPVVPRRTAVDFRTTLPRPVDFWSIYARGTYENAPRFAQQQFRSMPGRFLFMLDHDLDTRKLHNGVYILSVFVRDERGNGVAISRRLSILNARTPTGCRLEQPPPPPTTTTEPPPPETNPDDAPEPP